MLQPDDEIFFEQCATAVCQVARQILDTRFNSIRLRLKLQDDAGRVGADVIDAATGNIKEQFIVHARTLLDKGAMPNGRRIESDPDVMLLAKYISDNYFVLASRTYLLALDRAGVTIPGHLKGEMADKAIYSGYQFETRLAVPFARILERRTQRLAKASI